MLTAIVLIESDVASVPEVCEAIASLDATLTPAPTIEKVSGVDALIVKGHYPTKPQQANFELKYTMDDGTWKLIGIKIKTTSN